MAGVAGILASRSRIAAVAGPRFNGVGEVPPGFLHAFVVRADGGMPRQITSGDYDHGGRSFGGGSVAWTPDGAELILSARRGERPEWNSRESDLWAFGVKDGAMRRLTDRFGPDQNPAVSPDGRLIAYTGYDDRKQGYQNVLLHVMNRDGSGKRVISGKLDQSVGSPTWSADGRGLYVVFDEQGNTKVALISLEGTVRVVARNLGSGSSAYSGGSYSVARDGSVAFTLSTPGIPSNVGLMPNAPGAVTKTLTALNAEFGEYGVRQLTRCLRRMMDPLLEEARKGGRSSVSLGFDPATGGAVLGLAMDRP